MTCLSPATYEGGPSEASCRLCTCAVPFLPVEMRQFVYVLYFLVFTTENSTMYSGLWKTHMGWVDQFLFQQSVLKLPFFFFIEVGLLIAAASTAAGRKNRAAPMDLALWLTLFTIVLFTLWGAMLGGKPWMAGWQLYPLVSAFIFAKLLLATMRTPAHFETLGKVIVGATFYRAIMCVVFWWFFAHNVYYREGPPPVMTTHDDTTLFVLTLFILIANPALRRTRRGLLAALIGVPFILIAIQLNNRRLAWVSLIAALLLFYLLLPAGKAKRRINWALVLASPLIGAYVAIGWGRREPIFRPLRSFSTITTKADSSTLARNTENQGLLLTLMRRGWVASAGWGQEYIEFDSTYSIAGIYKEWRYIPHNSVLGILAFTGVLGFAGLWMSIPVSAYLNARTFRVTKDPLVRVITFSTLAEVIVCTNQMYGDMGLQSQPTMFLLASGFAVAGRLSVSEGAWPARQKPRAIGAA